MPSLNHFTSCVLILGACASLCAETSSPLAFDNGRGTFEVIERLRFEDRKENFDFDSATHSATDDSWFVQRLRLGASWKPTSDWSFQVQLQDAREWDSERPNVPFILGSEGNDALDLRLAAVTYGDAKTSPVTFTLGRQILAFGEERLVGSSEWNNFARTFDAGKLVWVVEPGKKTLTVFVSSVVNILGNTSGSGWKMDHSSTNDIFSGVYYSEKTSPRETFDLYLFWRDKKENGPIYSAPNASIPAASRTAGPYDIAQDIYTAGLRYIRAPKAGEVDAEFEGSFQGGRVDRQTVAATGVYSGNSARLDQRAWAIHSLLGYTVPDFPGQVRFDIEYNVASGDKNRNDGTNGSFMNLFPSNHKFYGFMDVFAWKNLRETVASVRMTPMTATSLRLDYHDFSLFSSQDAWYRSNSASTVRPLSVAAQNAPRHAGSELDITGTWSPISRLSLDLGWSRFFAGAYLAATGPQSDANFFYAQTTLKF